MESRLTWRSKIGYGVGTIGKSMSYGLASGFISYWFLSGLGLSPAFLGVMLFVARLWDGVNDLLMGAIIDSTRTKWGKFRPWMVIGAVTNAAVTVLLFTNPGFRGVGLYVYATVCFVLWDMTYTMIDVSYWAMIPALTLDSHDRDQVSMLPRIFGGAAGIVGAFTLQITDKLGGVANGGFMKYALLTSGIYILTVLICAGTVRERIAPPPQQKEERFSLIRSAKILFHNDQALVIVVIMILFNLAINLTNAVNVFYFVFVIGSKDQYTFFTILLGASQAIGLLGYPLFSKWFGRNRVNIASLVLPCIGYLLMFLSTLFLHGQFLPFAAAAFVMSAGFGSMGVMQNVMLADAVDYGEWRTGERNEGVIFSMLTFLSKVAAGLSSLITMLGFAAVGFEGKEDSVATPQAVNCIEFMMYILPPLMLLVALAIYFKKFKLKPALVKQISHEIQQRRGTEYRG